MEEKFSLLSTLADSFALLFRNPDIFIPYVAMIFVGMIFSIVNSYSLGNIMRGNIDMHNISILIFSIILSFFIAVIFYGWIFLLIKQLIRKRKKIDFTDAFFSGIDLFWRIFGIAVIIAAISFIISLIMGFLIFTDYFIFMKMLRIDILTAIMTIATFLIFIAILIFFVSPLLFLFPVLIINKKGVFATITKAFRYSWRNKKYTVSSLVITLAMFIIGYIPFFLFSTYIGDTIQYMMQDIVKYQFINFLLGIPMMLFFIWLLIFYFLVYDRTRAYLIK